MGMVDSCDSSVLLTHTDTHSMKSLDVVFSVIFKGKQGKSVVLSFIFHFVFFPFCVRIDAKLRSQAAGSFFFKFLGQYHQVNIDLVYCPLKLFCP